MIVFTDEECETISQDIDRQLQELRLAASWQSNQSSLVYGAPHQEDTTADLPAPQARAIAQITGESAPSFLKRFGHNFKKHLCSQEGMLYQQWKAIGDINNGEAIRLIAAGLAVMGFSESELGDKVVRLLAAVIVILTWIGLETFCEDFGA